jgi:hypothetical protein
MRHVDDIAGKGEKSGIINETVKVTISLEVRVIGKATGGVEDLDSR